MYFEQHIVWIAARHPPADGRQLVVTLPLHVAFRRDVDGASAGAVNAIILADGLARGGPEEARKRLADFWRAASLAGNLPDLQRRAVDRLFSFWPIEDTPVGLWMQALSRYLSPYDLNPLNINPLKDLVGRFVDFEAVRAAKDLQLFVSATNVKTGELRVFRRDEMTADMIVASACLPHLFRAVEIDGESYWDGGYVGNPALYPLVGATGFTGSRKAGLQLKAAADKAGKPIYLEMSSVNPIFVLPGALHERSAKVANELYNSCSLGAGQFCTNPGLTIVLQGEEGEAFLEEVRGLFEAKPAGILLGASGLQGIAEGVAELVAHGAEVVTGGHEVETAGYCFQNTILRVSGEAFLNNPHALQTEAFGTVNLMVFAKDIPQMVEIAAHLEGNLGEHHSGELHRASAEAKADRIMAEELKRNGWAEADLAARRKNDPVKLEIAARLRRETTLPLKAIAQRVKLGTSKAANARLHDHMKRAGDCEPSQPQLGI